MEDVDSSQSSDGFATVATTDLEAVVEAEEEEPAVPGESSESTGNSGEGDPSDDKEEEEEEEEEVEYDSGGEAEDEEEAKEGEEHERQANMARGLYIRKNVELVLYGYTDGCSGCDAAIATLRPTTHSPACRLRIVQAMRAAGDTARLESAAKRAADRRA